MPTPRSDITRQDRQAKLLTVTQAAQRAGVSRNTIGSWITSGQLPAVRIAGRRHIHPDDLVATQTRAHLGTVLPAWRHHPQRAGKRLRALREAAGLTQQDLAVSSGLTHEAISRLETGSNAASAETVRALAQALAVEPGVFVARTTIAPVGLTTAEVAARLDVPRGRVQTWLARGKLPGSKVSGQWRVPRVAVLELERHERLRGRSRRLDPRYRG